MNWSMPSMLLFRPRSINKSYTNDCEYCAKKAIEKKEALSRIIDFYFFIFLEGGYTNHFLNIFKLHHIHATYQGWLMFYSITYCFTVRVQAESLVNEENIFKLLRQIGRHSLICQVKRWGLYHSTSALILMWHQLSRPTIFFESWGLILGVSKKGKSTQERNKK